MSIPTVEAPTPFPTPRKKQQKQLKKGASTFDSRNVIVMTPRQKKLDELKRDSEREVDSWDFNFICGWMIGGFCVLQLLQLTSDWVDVRNNHIIFFFIFIVMSLWFLRSFALQMHRKYVNPRVKRIWDRTQDKADAIEDEKLMMKGDDLEADMNFIFGNQYMIKED